MVIKSEIKKGSFYTALNEKNNYDIDMEECIKKTVNGLLDNETTAENPGMLLGKIQSGKTRAFLGTIALSFDNNYDIAVILTKGTKALTQQTLKRLRNEYLSLIDNDKVQIFDIMRLPKNLTGYELEQKMIFIVKKEIKNMERLHTAFTEDYPALKDKKILLVDDEADFASVGFSKTRKDGTNIKKIAGSIDEFRTTVLKASYLQVTATPYSLYLQPEDMFLDSKHLTFKPIKPKFTVLVPVHDKYIGGEYYFDESEEESSIAYHLYEPVEDDELRILKKEDKRSFKLENSLTSGKVKSLRHAIVNFIVGACIRRLQDENIGNIEKKYSFIIHTEQNKNSHSWQEQIIFSVKNQLTIASEQDNEVFNKLLKKSYDNLCESINIYEISAPPYDIVKDYVRNVLKKGHTMITVVNSEKEVEELLDDSGQLKLRTPLNIFIGGQILDRGITIGNLIGFYYGRKPQRFQQDTVLQHSRMYGARPKEDLTVTRFYTTTSIYAVMKKIHEFDSALRTAFQEGAHDSGVVFIQKDTKNKIIPCSPNKILLSSTTTLKPSLRLLPTGFQIKPKTSINKIVTPIDNIVDSYVHQNENKDFLMNIDDALRIVNLIAETFIFDYEWDVKAFLASLEYLCKQTKIEGNRNKVWVLVRKNRETKRLKKDGRFENSPDSYQEKGEARNLATDIPALILLRQNGKEENGWKGHAFWWPILIIPSETKTVVFSSDLINEQQEL